MGRCDARQRNFAQYLFELTLTNYSLCGHWPSHLAKSAVIISSCSQSPACPAVAEVPSLSQDGYSSNYWSQTETPRREEWSVSSFSRRFGPLHSVCEGPPFPYGSHLPSGPALGPEKQSPCRLIGVRGKTIRRGIHGSTLEHREELSAVVPVSHENLGATAYDTGSVGESVSFDEREASIGVRREKCNSDKGTGGMER